MRVWGNRHSYTISGSINLYNHFGGKFGSICQNSKQNSNLWASNFTCWLYSTEGVPHKYTQKFKYMEVHSSSLTKTGQN